MYVNLIGMAEPAVLGASSQMPLMIGNSSPGQHDQEHQSASPLLGLCHGLSCRREQLSDVALRLLCGPTTGHTLDMLAGCGCCTGCQFGHMLANCFLLD